MKMLLPPPSFHLLLPLLLLLQMQMQLQMHNSQLARVAFQFLLFKLSGEQKKGKRGVAVKQQE